MSRSSPILGSRTQDWFQWLGVFVAMVLLGFLYREPLADIISRSRGSVEQGYILMVPAIAAYLVFVRRSRLWGDRGRRGAFIGPLIVGASFGAAIVGHDRDILVLWHSAPVIAFVGLVVATVGLRRTTLILPGLFILFAIVPLPGVVRQYLAQPLQGFATGVTAFMLDLFGVPAIKTGNLIEINGFPVAVGEACNGMRLVMPLAIVMYAFVFSLPLRPNIRFLLLLLSLPVALVCNVARLVPTAVAYGYFPDVATQVHDVGGWLMIPLAIGLLLGIFRLLEWIDIPVSRFRLAMS